MKTEMLGMILAGGRGTRLLDLTKKDAKPAVYFGGKYRIIDFPLSNCANSGVGVVGVLTQYESIFLTRYASQGALWGLEGKNKGTYVLSPREKATGFGLYAGTADAIYQNIEFMDQYNPEYVLILSGDHIYKMDYEKMLEFHKANNADLTIAGLTVTLEEAKRFGIMNTNPDNSIYEFEEKPANPKNDQASMGIYIFSYPVLREELIKDAENPDSEHDFGKNIIPTLLSQNKRLFAYPFEGYWKDVGTIDSLWEANMDLLADDNPLDISNDDWKIFTEDSASVPQYIGAEADVSNSMINQGSIINGSVKHSIIFKDVNIEAGATVEDSVIMPGVTVKKGAVVKKCIVSPDLTVKEDTVLDANDKVLLVTEKEVA